MCDLEDRDRVNAAVRGGGRAAAPLAIIGKHLCGAATDAVLRYDNAERYCIALCCHAKADGELYVNKPFVAEALRLSGHERCDPALVLRQLHRITAYQHCYGAAPLSAGQRASAAAAFQARQILDVGRMLYLRDRGFSAVKIVQYCDRAVSGECWCLTASV